MWELLLIVLSLFAHFLDARQHLWSRILTFPILCISIYAYSLRQLWGKVLHSIIALFINTYAYMQWKGNTKRTPIKVTKTSHKILMYATICILAIPAIRILMIKKQENLPLISVYFDTFYFVSGLIEKWMMARKKLERWTFAFFRYIGFSIACYYAGSKELSLHHLFLAGIAIYGQKQWWLAYTRHSTLSTFSQLKSGSSLPKCP